MRRRLLQDMTLEEQEDLFHDIEKSDKLLSNKIMDIFQTRDFTIPSLIEKLNLHLKADHKVSELVEELKKEGKIVIIHHKFKKIDGNTYLTIYGIPQQ